MVLTILTNTNMDLRLSQEFIDLQCAPLPTTMEDFQFIYECEKRVDPSFTIQPRPIKKHHRHPPLVKTMVK